MLGLKGKTAVVTGGDTRATAERPAAEGAHVFITGRRKTELDEAVGSSVTAVPGDITDPADLNRLYDAVRDRGQGLEVLFADAATASSKAAIGRMGRPEEVASAVAFPASADSSGGENQI